MFCCFLVALHSSYVDLYRYKYASLIYRCTLISLHNGTLSTEHAVAPVPVAWLSSRGRSLTFCETDDSHLFGLFIFIATNTILHVRFNLISRDAQCASPNQRRHVNNAFGADPKYDRILLVPVSLSHILSPVLPALNSVMTKVSSRLYSLFRTAENDLTSFLIGVLSNALLILAGVTAVLEYWWRPINCHAPATFTDAAWKYAESYCYNSRWSFLPLESLEKHGETGADLESRWVKDDRAWIPVLLLAHAMILRLPHFIWILLSKCSSVNLGSLIKAAEAYSSLDATGRQSAVKTAADYLNSRFCLRFPEGRMSKWATMRDYWQCVKHPFPSGILALAAVLTKLIYGIATSATFLKLCNFMRVENGSDFGWREVNAFYAGSEREDLRILPKVVLCDYEVRQLGNIHRYTIQCTLPLNHFYTFLLIVLWFAYYFAQGFCWLSFAHTALTTLLPWPQKWFIVRALHRRRALVPPVDSVYFQTGALTSGYQATRHSSSTVPTSQQVASPLELRLFVESYIRTDGCFLLKHVSQHNDLFVYELINQLWQQFSTPPVSLPSVYDHSVDQSPATRHKYFVDQRAPASVETARKIVPAPVAMAATPATMNQQTAVSSALHKEGGKDHHAKMLEETHDERPLLGHQNEHGRHWEHVETTK